MIQYFSFLKRHNYIFDYIELDIILVESFKKETMAYVEEVDSKINTDPEIPNKIISKSSTDIFDSDDDEMEEINFEMEEVVQNKDQSGDVQDLPSDKQSLKDHQNLDHNEYVSRCSSSSLIANKYKEDTTCYSVANQLSDSIISFESSHKEDDSKSFPLEDYYKEEEIFESDDESDLEVLEELPKDDELLIPLLTVKKITTKAMNQLRSNDRSFCKCQVEKRSSIDYSLFI